jgi:outer membrane protein OmpA-like peptidoglycan-associated protein
MRSRLVLALALVAGCAKKDQIEQCYPMSSLSAPVFRCAGAAPPAPPPVAVKEPEPPPPPPPPPPKVEVKEDRIELNEKVNFETGKATLLPASKTLLDEVAQVLADHPEIQKIRIEGHTDNQGGAASNLRLSNNRAKAVREYLISKKIEGKRLESKGFGQSKPIGDNKTDDGREQNRRVEMHILKRSK